MKTGRFTYERKETGFEFSDKIKPHEREVLTNANFFIDFTHPPMWTDSFDKIFLISLPTATARRQIAEETLQKYNIPYELVPGIYNQDGAYGIYLTLQKLLTSCVKECDRILVFEDDCLFCNDEPGLCHVMGNCIEQLPADYDLFYLGVNTHRNFDRFHSPNLLPIYEGYGLHAVSYSKSGMEKVLALPPYSGTPIDVMIDREIQSQGKCFCSYPLLVTQHNGYSDIKKIHMDQGYIVERFYKFVKHLLQ